ncbi:oligogalacturonate lyase family protein [Paenibacillus agricola]|uniref:Oligogalacturonide lyase n=1 Tax=Paenibacillus agricola TaxID=2716264 RepID=A0ABX0JDJ7_9BACL|nr:oligogalacturonate lyase family protein [Paenibacillus agricola]NHN31770.1 oligogalacturonide lyase [Paenibacillus agricola]
MQGTIYSSEHREYRDKISGRRILQLTDYFAHSNHLYFTNQTFYKGDVIFKAQRGNASNLFRFHMDTMNIEQLTDLPQPAYNDRYFDRLLLSYVHEGNEEVYMFYLGQVLALNLKTLQQRVLFDTPAGFYLSSGSPSSDGRYVVVSITENKVHREFEGGFYETWAAFPETRLIRIDLETGKAETLYSENYWIKHVNMSPTVPNLLTFCHEGPWHHVDHRVWMLDTNTGQATKLVLDQSPLKTVGHEYWFVDGIHLGYHGKKTEPNGDVHGYYGSIKYDNSEQLELDFPFHSQHFHSNDLNLIVGDGERMVNPHVLLWKRTEAGFDQPRVLAYHGGMGINAATHVHPRFTADASQVLFTSDRGGYANLYLVEVGNVDELPRLEDVQAASQPR